MVWGYPYFWKHPYQTNISLDVFLDVLCWRVSYTRWNQRHNSEVYDKVQTRKTLPLEPFGTLRPLLNDFCWSTIETPSFQRLSWGFLVDTLAGGWRSASRIARKNAEGNSMISCSVRNCMEIEAESNRFGNKFMVYCTRFSSLSFVRCCSWCSCLVPSGAYEDRSITWRDAVLWWQAGYSAGSQKVTCLPGLPKTLLSLSFSFSKGGICIPSLQCFLVMFSFLKHKVHSCKPFHWWSTRNNFLLAPRYCD